ncbi:MAG TPA: hypothetical protein VFV05_05065 [Methylomirabilota bacterium]|nr:hypothetical protein [Methylomirabilota bacterium]
MTVVAVIAAAMIPPAAWSQPKKLVFWTHWEQYPRPEYNLVTAAAVVSVLPILTVFLVCQRWIVRGVVLSGLKG